MAGRAARPGMAGLLLLCLQCNQSAEGPGDPAPVFQPALSSTAAEVRDFLAKAQGGPKARLAYIDRTGREGRLCYLDFAEAAQPGPYPAIHCIAAAAGAKVPVISPDGEWIVYAVGSGVEAGSVKGSRSSAYLVRMREDAQPTLIAADSACEPRFVQNAPGRLEIVYSTMAPNAAWEGFGRTLKVRVDVSGAAPVVGETVVLNAGGGFTGGLSWDNRFLCGGGEHVAMRDLGADGIGGPGDGPPDTVSFKGIQSCNASISSSRAFTHTMMYLNTSGSHPSLNGGKPWGEWQAILIGDRAGNLIKGYMPPAAFSVPLETGPPSLSESRWHHNEWSNHPYFATATLNADRYFKTGDAYSNTGFQERIYLLNLRDSSYLEVLRPDRIRYTGEMFGGFFWPWLWVEVPDGFRESENWLRADSSLADPP